MARKKITFKSENSKNISEALAEFLEAKKLENKRPRTIGAYKEFVEWFIRFAGDIDVTQIDNELIKNYIESMTCAKTTINTRLVHLSVFVNWIRDREYNINPRLKIKTLKVDDTKVKDVYTKEMLTKILTHNSKRKESYMGYQFKVIVSVLINTGLRASEVCSLRVTDLDFSNDVIYTNHTKSGYPRILPMSKSLKFTLQKFLDKRNIDAEYLFCTAFGEQLTYKSLSMMNYRLCKKLEIPITSLHAYRRTFITNAVNNDVDIIKLSKITGHKELKVLDKYYVNSKKEINKLSNKVDLLGDLALEDKVKKKLKLD